MVNVKRMVKCLDTARTRFGDLPDIQCEIVAAVLYCVASKVDATAATVVDVAGFADTLGRKVLADLVTAAVLAAHVNPGDPNADTYTIAGKVAAKPRAPKLKIVASAPVNILDPAFLRVDAPPVDGAPPADPAVDADKGPETGPVAQAMLATAAVPVGAGPDDESALIGWRRHLATLATEIDAVKSEIRTIRARMRAAGKVDAGPGERVSYRAAGERDPRLPVAGTVKEREHNGVTYKVEIGESDFGYDGARYKSLTAIANLILGRTNGVNGVNGIAWFGYADKRPSNATPRAPKSTNASTAAPVKPAPMGFGAAIAAVKVASAPPAAVPAPESTPDPVPPAQTPPTSTPDADPFLAELESLGNVATPAPAVKVATGKRAPRTFSASKNA